MKCKLEDLTQVFLVSVKVKKILSIIERNV